jgi:hypothetical protein
MLEKAEKDLIENKTRLNSFLSAKCGDLRIVFTKKTTLNFP